MLANISLLRQFQVLDKLSNLNETNMCLLFENLLQSDATDMESYFSASSTDGYSKLVRKCCVMIVRKRSCKCIPFMLLFPIVLLTKLRLPMFMRHWRMSSNFNPDRSIPAYERINLLRPPCIYQNSLCLFSLKVWSHNFMFKLKTLGMVEI